MAEQRSRGAARNANAGDESRKTLLGECSQSKSMTAVTMGTVATRTGVAFVPPSSRDGFGPVGPLLVLGPVVSKKRAI